MLKFEHASILNPLKYLKTLVHTDTTRPAQQNNMTTLSSAHLRCYGSQKTAQGENRRYALVTIDVECLKKLLQNTGAPHQHIGALLDSIGKTNKIC